MTAFPVLLPGFAAGGNKYVNGYLQTILGKRTSGRVLNVGAGAASARYRYAEMLANTEYHTVEPSPETNPTFVADAQHMPEIPSESYDWVISLAVLEHVPDIHSAAREIARVVKPGGHIYVTIPLHNEIHFDKGYWDYWRVTPFGMHCLFGDSFAILEMEFWGDSVVDPVAISVLARKGGERVPEISKLFHIPGGYDTVSAYIDGATPFLDLMQVWRLRLPAPEYYGRVSQWRNQYFKQTGGNIPIRYAEDIIRPQLAIHEGTIVLQNNGAQYVTVQS
jgi:SAM-dependent methyltransferase